MILLWSIRAAQAVKSCPHRRVLGRQSSMRRAITSAFGVLLPPAFSNSQFLIIPKAHEGERSLVRLLTCNCSLDPTSWNAFSILALYFSRV